MRRLQLAFAAVLSLGLIGGVVGAADVVIAADPPAGVAFDGSVTVIFRDPAYFDGQGMAGATIALEASRADLPAPGIIQTLDGQTGPDGTLVLGGVARPDGDGAAPITLRVRAHLDTTVTRSDGCTEAFSLDGLATADAAPTVIIELGVAGGSSSIECPTVVIAGRVVDEAGQPFEAVSADATITIGGETSSSAVAVAADGAFRFELPSFTASSAPVQVSLIVIGPPTGTVTNPDGCLDTSALVARSTWTLDAPVSPSARTLGARSELVSSVCDVVGTPRPTQPAHAPRPTHAPRHTLPPTDLAAAGANGGTGPDNGSDLTASTGSALLALLVVLLSAATTIARRSRRG